MAREKLNAWGCEHPMPIEVVLFGEGRRTRCLTCGQCGPTPRRLYGRCGERRAAGRGSAPESSAHRTSGVGGYRKLANAASRAVHSPLGLVPGAVTFGRRASGRVVA